VDNLSNLLDTVSCFVQTAVRHCVFSKGKKVAKTSAKTPIKSSENGVRDVQFVNYELPDEERRRFKAWLHENAGEIYTFLDKLIDDGYGFSCKWDEYGDCAAAFIQCKKDGNPNKGWLLTGRGSTALSAIGGVLYRHYVLFEGVWPIEQNRRGVLDDE